MDAQTIESLKDLSKVIEEQMNDFRTCLNYLTTDGSGLLHSLKTTVGADTQLGHAVTDVGSSIMQAKNKAFDAFSVIKELIDEKAKTAEQIAIDSIAKYDNASGITEGITFK